MYLKSSNTTLIDTKIKQNGETMEKNLLRVKREEEEGGGDDGENKEEEAGGDDGYGSDKEDEDGWGEGDWGEGKDFGEEENKEIECEEENNKKAEKEWKKNGGGNGGGNKNIFAISQNVKKGKGSIMLVNKNRRKR
uniref:Uncharacterized protein n=1 Tax=Meloidogyne javanica TaxID=6303 RepID=A0A915LWT6_MELJA